MADLVLRPSGRPAPKDWALQLRVHDCCGPTEYETLLYTDEHGARTIIEAGRPYWLFGDPNEDRVVSTVDDAKPNRMSLEQAIAHADEKAVTGGPCGDAHHQLADWLRELQHVRVGKARAGREIDGRTWGKVPE